MCEAKGRKNAVIQNWCDSVTLKMASVKVIKSKREVNGEMSQPLNGSKNDFTNLPTGLNFGSQDV